MRNYRYWSERTSDAGAQVVLADRQHPTTILQQVGFDQISDLDTGGLFSSMLLESALVHGTCARNAGLGFVRFKCESGLTCHVVCDNFEYTGLGGGPVHLARQLLISLMLFVAGHDPVVRVGGLREYHGGHDEKPKSGDHFLKNACREI